MNYLELCADLHLQAGISGTAPSSVTGQTGENKRIVNWVKRAWTDIQTMRSDWLFLKESFTLDTVSGQSSYNIADLVLGGSLADSRFRLFDKKSFRIYKSSIGEVDEVDLCFSKYEDFRSAFIVGQQVQGRPDYFTVTPSNTLYLDPIPDDVYRITGEFIKTPQVLTGNTDVPELPAHFHDLIIYHALIAYAYFEAASEVVEYAKEQKKLLMNALLREQLPDVSLAGSLME
jgi:hypothetical protein